MGRWSGTCRTCGQCIPPEWNVKLSIKQAEKRSATLDKKREKGEHIGRPRKVDRDLVRKMREEGMSMAKIADTLNCSTGSVHAALKSAALQPKEEVGG